MNFRKMFFICVVLADSSKKVSCQDPITLALLAAGTIISTYVFSTDNVVKNNLKLVAKRVGQKIGFFEGCEDYWIPGNINVLREDLNNNVFGQPIAIDMVINALEQHLNNKQPTRALALSFHGDPGTGKNFVSQKILKNMFRRGHDTEYVNFFRGSIDFPSKFETETYKNNIVRIIKEKIYECHRSVFVFDEVEKMPSGILDVLSGFMKIGKVGDYDFRRAIFILLSNIGSRALYQETLTSWTDGESRENMSREHLSRLLSKEAFNAKGGLLHSVLIKGMYVTHFVPFLPLERSHVIQCLKTEVKRLDQIMSDELEEQVLQELEFKPDENPIFAYGGCKIVPEKVQFFITRQQWINRKRARGYNDEL